MLIFFEFLHMSLGVLGREKNFLPLSALIIFSPIANSWWGYQFLHILLPNSIAVVCHFCRTGGKTYAQVRWSQITICLLKFLPFVINPEKLVLWVGRNPFFILEMRDRGSHSILDAVKRITEAYNKF